MDQCNPPNRLPSLINALVANIRAGLEVDQPFFHVEFDRVFPDDLYADMISAMPAPTEYRPLPGRNKENIQPDGKSTRVKIDLFPESLRGEKERGIWDIVGRALCSVELRMALVERLAPALARRFGPRYAAVGMYPVAVLTRDIPGYRIRPHTDTNWKGITLQIYLPRDASATHIGTILHGRLPDGSLSNAKRMRFAPNRGYAFSVGADSWHSADPLGTEVATRDSILLAYFVDAGPIRILRNRGKRAGNFVLNEVRHLLHRATVQAAPAFPSREIATVPQEARAAPANVHPADDATRAGRR
jgi:hypothetical protein